MTQNSINFVPRPRFDMPEGVDLLMLYSISVLLVFGVKLLVINLLWGN